MTNYTQQWFTDRAQRADRDAHLMVPEILRMVGKHPDSVFDFGCGDGALLKWFRGATVRQVIGIDANGPDEWSRDGGLHLRLDLTKPIDLRQTADMVVCLEVAEHLEEEHAAQLIETLCRHGKRVVFSAAPPGQEGTGHVNLKPMAWWAELFARHGFVEQDILRHRLPPEVSWWFHQNATLFCHESALVTIPTACVTMARYRDSFREVHDAVAQLTHDPVIREPDFRLIRDGYRSRRLDLHELAYSAVVAKMRSALATEHLEHPHWRQFEYSLHIDADQAFAPQQAIDLLVSAKAHDFDILTGFYVTKQEEARIVHMPPVGSQTAVWGPVERPYELPGIGFGFVATHRRVLEKLVAHRRPVPWWDVGAMAPRFIHEPIVVKEWVSKGQFSWSFFQDWRDGKRDDKWLDRFSGMPCEPQENEDYVFSRKCREAGIPIMCDPRIFVGHIGRKRYDECNLAHLTGGAK